METAKQILKEYFGYDSFRSQQDTIIQTVLEKKDCLVLMPTGGGKSICYQIPALLMPGVCIVISPLISLMKDQVENLKANGIEAAFLNSTLSIEEHNTIIYDVIHEKIKLLYVSPEKLLSASFFNVLNQLPLNLIAVDEAHCISSWGHDFRPEYARLNILKKSFPKVPLIALTATADRVIKEDIIKQLGLDRPQVFISSFDRPNLSLTVLPGRSRFVHIRDFIIKRPGQSGIIYCLSRKSTEAIAAKLNKIGIKAAGYHAGMTSAERSKTQEDFINDKTPIITATIAFGMGIDKLNVRWIIHYNLPKNIESYYQQIGRAGRDGLPAETILFYSFGDIITLRNIIEENGNQEVQLHKLERMKQFAEAVNCRRKILLNYFGENTEHDCGNCDVCRNPPVFFDGTIIAQKALSALVRIKHGIGQNTLIDVLRGSSKHEILKNGYHNIKTYGAGKDISYAEWQHYIVQLINFGLIEIAYNKGNTLCLTEHSKDVLFNNKTIQLIHPAITREIMDQRAQSAKPKTKKQQLDKNLFEELKVLRKKLADQSEVPAYVVFSDTTLTEMASSKPIKKVDLLDITGVGQKKLDLYGDMFIDKIIAFIQNASEQGSIIKGGTYLVTHEHYKQGLSVEEIAGKRGLNISTIYSHLAQLYENGENIDIQNMIDKTELQTVVQAIKQIGIPEKLKTMFDYLNQRVEYHKIRLAFAYHNREKSRQVIDIG